MGATLGRTQEHGDAQQGKSVMSHRADSEQTEEASAGGEPGCGSLGELVGAEEELLCGTGGCQRGFNRFLESYFL